MFNMRKEGNRLLPKENLQAPETASQSLNSEEGSSPSNDAMASDHFADHDTGDGFQGEAQGDAGAGPRVDHPEAEAALTALFIVAVGGIGGAICARYQVEELEPEEVQALAASVGTLSALYAPALTEKQAAWIGLGVTTAVIAAPRWTEYQNREAMTVDAKPEPEPDGDE